MNRQFLLVCCLACLSIAAMAQPARTPRDRALEFLREVPARFQLSAADVADVRVTNEYVSSHNGITHVWLQQQYHGIPVFNALFGLHVKPNGEVLHLGHRFVADLDRRINTQLPALSAARALELAMRQLGLEAEMPALRQKINDQNFIFEGGKVSKSPITVSVCFQPLNKGEVKLAWTMVIAPLKGSDVWNLRVDALTGSVLDKINQTVYCKAPDAIIAGSDCEDGTVSLETPRTQGQLGATETYNVFAFPAESPAHGNRVLLSNPADLNASPFGWLDDNGVDGPEYTYTRGNNVWSFDDSASDNTPTIAESADGGPSYTFNFPYDPDAEPAANKLAAISNLFYVNNFIHDFSYKFGFDEVSGNFQANNYGKSGKGGDYVLAQALDGSGTDNANFSTPADGGNGSMQMYTWSRQGGKIVTVNAPGAILGAYSASNASWSPGTAVTSTPVTGDVVIVNDGTPEGSLGCGSYTGLNGKIALIDRGVCEFGLKALNAQNAGAKGCIICNFEDGTISMASGQVGSSVNIPVVMMGKGDCDKLRQYAGASLNVSLVQPAVTGPAYLDGDFDNGIIAHEYGHGISNRLTGGPDNAGCLGNNEQMGEGWSDFMSLVTTVKTGDVGAKKRGVGTFVFRQDNDGQGIRRYPYSTDMSINPITFSTVAENTEVHALGEVWTAMLWDLYWAMVEKYGFDPSYTDKNSGNYRAVQLVFDGMKLQPCSPGFQDGRDAIILADKINYNSVDTCLISSVFARRGLGYFATQGSSNNAADGIENFDPIPTCVRELKIAKSTSTPTVDPNGTVEVRITVTNHKAETVTGVIVSDELPAGLNFVSASNGGTASNGFVLWDLGALPTGTVVNLSYTAKVADGVKSLCYYRDPMDDTNNWFSVSIETNGSDEYFDIQNAEKKVGTGAFKGAASTTAFTDFTLENGNFITVFGAKPVFRFWHKFNTETGADAGFIEIQRVDDPNGRWVRLPANKMLRNPYSGKVQYGTFAIPYLYGFSGNSDWIQSYADLSDYIGKDIYIRFRMGTDNNNGPTGGAWYIDEVSLIDMVNFEPVATVVSAQGDKASAELKQGGIIINTDCGVVAANEPNLAKLEMTLQPNPAQDVLSVSLNQALQGQVQISLVNPEGRVIIQRKLDNFYEGQIVSFDVQQVPQGMYLVRLQSQAGTTVSKVVIH